MQLRNRVLNEVQKILHGPINGSGEEIDKNPLDFYTVGILFPRMGSQKDFSDDSLENVSVSDEGDNIGFDTEESNVLEEGLSKNYRDKIEKDEFVDNDEFELTTKFRPSAAGVSVLIKKNSSLSLKVEFAVYEKKTKEKQQIEQSKVNVTTVYKRLGLSKEFLSKNGIFEFGESSFKEEPNVINVDLGRNAYLSITTRPYEFRGDVEIKTFTLINNIDAVNFRSQKNAESCLFQPVISIRCEDGFMHFEDMSDLSILSEEDINLKLLYRNYKTYALGHGISVNWEKSNDSVSLIETSILPIEEVNGVNLNPDVFNGKNILFIKKLGGKSISDDYDWEIVRKELIDFIEEYSGWINRESSVIDLNKEGIPSELVMKAQANLLLCKKLYSRMKAGIETLSNNSSARKSFEDANKAMFIQRIMADFSKHRRNERRVLCNNSDMDDPLPDYSKIPFDASSGDIWKDGKLDVSVLQTQRKGNLARWRPFQLAFLLSQVNGITDTKSEDRDTVDLIWFPTGGGKTEAYLGLTAFTIFYRRLIAKKDEGNPNKGAGVSVLMRYTLRLLNKQQFERASILICACDLIRRREPDSYGSFRISNGIWMGRSMTPNKIEDQVEDYKYYIKEIDKNGSLNLFKNSPPLLSCPCCGNRLVKEMQPNGAKGRWGYFRKRNSLNKEHGAYLIGCTNTKCDYFATAETYKINSENNLPIYEVDKVIYEQRPSLLFSTVDKFVQLAWNSECFNLFNVEFQDGQTSRLYPAPDLIIQDELHLISSALGTIYGVYEIVIDKLCKESGGSMPKIVGASATVRNAQEQCKRLYSRTNFLQFPPPGTNADDSFYSQKIIGSDAKSRLYVGFMPSGVTTSTALIRLTSVLLERIPTLNESNKNLDPYYTLVVYFNALKELGKFRTFLTDDIVAYRKLLANHFSTFIKPFNNNSLCELSSVMTADEITTGLDRLEKTTLPNERSSDNPLIKALFESGIRTVHSLRTAKGRLWKEKFLTESFFKLIDLDFKGDGKIDFDSFMRKVNELIPGQVDPIHIAPATNMISVGVDIARLNTMIVNGQPKTTAEYIQASSRVGREHPGVVFTFLSPTKNRDRSHYEQFKSFHQAYYYYVESNSVTPFSRAALEKVLPTVLITLTRSLYLKGINGVFSAREGSYRQFIDTLLEEIKERGKQIYGENAYLGISEIINKIKEDYFNRIDSFSADLRLAKYSDYMKRNPITGTWNPSLANHFSVYNAPSQFVDRILDEHIPTMQTLRNVESSSLVSIKI